MYMPALPAPYPGPPAHDQARISAKLAAIVLGLLILLLAVVCQSPALSLLQSASPPSKLSPSSASYVAAAAGGTETKPHHPARPVPVSRRVALAGLVLAGSGMHAKHALSDELELSPPSVDFDHLSSVIREVPQGKPYEPSMEDDRKRRRGASSPKEIDIASVVNW
mmetsp:Transcript_1873/g.3644  ORF Transcript_1873/g.3644 Transcript_1873/m.3644 type:complete len:166 (-) Transcript_1873:513-1010(-)